MEGWGSLVLLHQLLARSGRERGRDLDAWDARARRRPTELPLLGEPEGEKRTAVEVEADEVGPSLKWATAKVERQSRSSASSSSGDWGEKVAAPVGGATNQEETPLDAG